MTSEKIISLTEINQQPWEIVKQIAEVTDVSDWVLVGGLMTATHAMLNGKTSRPTTDVDMLIDLMSNKAVVNEVSSKLRSLGFEVQTPGFYDNPIHRFKKDNMIVDVLIADHLPKGISQKAEIKHIPMLPIEGGAQAIDRSVAVAFKTAENEFTIQIPDLLGAIILKGAAYQTDNNHPERHLEDAALLLGLLDNVAEQITRLHGSDGKRLRAIWEKLENKNHPAWLQLDEETRARGQNNLRILVMSVSHNSPKVDVTEVENTSVADFDEDYLGVLENPDLDISKPTKYSSDVKSPCPTAETSQKSA